MQILWPALTWVIWANGVGVFSRFSKMRELLMLENKLEKVRQGRLKMSMKKRTAKRNKNHFSVVVNPISFSETAFQLLTAA